jgi:hypothetical protein
MNIYENIKTYNYFPHITNDQFIKIKINENQWKYVDIPILDFNTIFILTTRYDYNSIVKSNISFKDLNKPKISKILNLSH